MASSHLEQMLKVSLKIKAIAFICLLILVVSGSLSWYFLRQSKLSLTAELEKRALTLAKGLAHNSRYGILSKDQVILHELIKGVLREDSVLAVRIVNARGTLLAQGDNFSQDNVHAMMDMSAPDTAGPWSPIDVPTVHLQTLGHQTLYRADAPVMTLPTPLSPSQQNLKSDILLLASESREAQSRASSPIHLGSVHVMLSPKAMYADFRATLTTGISMTLAIIVVGSLIAFVFCRYTLSPVQAMAKAASDIAAGDRTQQVKATSRDEIGVLAMTFNQMTTALDQHLSELSALHTIGLALSSTLEVEQLADRGLNAIVSQLGYDRALLLLVDDTRQALRHGRVAGVGEAIQTQVRQLLHIPLHQHGAVHARVALSGEPVLVQNITQMDDLADQSLAQVFTSRSFMVAPLKVDDRVLGVLSVARVRDNGPLTADDQRLVTTLANQMALALANVLAYQQIEQLNIGLEEKVHERTAELQRKQAALYEQAAELDRQRVQLHEVNRQLEIVSRHKSEFLANMSHELRTPLNAVIGFSHVLLEQMFGDLNPRQIEYLNDILSSGEYLLSLINDILDLAKIEAGVVTFEPGVLDLRSLLENSLVMIKEEARTRRIQVSLEMDVYVDKLYGDERKIKQILFNLLSNAVKFTPDGGQLGIRATQTDFGVQIAVWDTGIGIAPQDQPRIFDAFQQVQTDYARQTEGAGLGLSLTKKLVGLHGGTIRVKSTPSQGSTFSFTLPISRAGSDVPGAVQQWERLDGSGAAQYTKERV